MVGVAAWVGGDVHACGYVHVALAGREKFL